MKLIRLRHVAMVALAALLMVGCTSMQLRLGGGEALATNAAKRVVAAYDVASLLAQADMVLTRSLMAELPAAVGKVERQRLRQAINNAFDTTVLVDSVRQSLKQQALKTRHVQALADAATALETPLARRLHGLQAQVGNAGFADDYNEFIQKTESAPYAARLKQIKTLVQHMGIIDVQSAFQLALLETMLKTRNAVTGPELYVSRDELAAKLAQNNRIVREQLKQQLPPILLYVYRNVVNASLQDYVDLQGAPALLWTNGALATAVRSALERAGKQVQIHAEGL